MGFSVVIIDHEPLMAARIKKVPAYGGPGYDCRRHLL